VYQVIWYMYSSDRMIFYIITDYDKNIVSKDCQMFYFYIYL